MTTNPVAAMIAIGMKRRGLAVSSPKSAAVSKPMYEVTPKMMP